MLLKSLAKSARLKKNQNSRLGKKSLRATGAVAAPKFRSDLTAPGHPRSSGDPRRASGFVRSVRKSERLPVAGRPIGSMGCARALRNLTDLTDLTAHRRSKYVVRSVRKSESSPMAGLSL